MKRKASSNNINLQKKYKLTNYNLSYDINNIHMEINTIKLQLNIINNNINELLNKKVKKNKPKNIQSNKSIDMNSLKIIVNELLQENNKIIKELPKNNDFSYIS